MNGITSARGQRSYSAVVIIIALAVWGLCVPRVAHADTRPPTGVPATVSADALPTWQVNGVVWSQVLVGNTVYVTGAFTKARPPGVAIGGVGEVDALNIFAYDVTTGNRVASFNHSLNAQGMVITKSPDGSRVYVGGDFTSVDGAAHGHVVAFVTATGEVDPAFGANVSNEVRGITAVASEIYIGGSFSAVNGEARSSLAAVTPTGALLPWAPTADNGSIWTMVMAPDNSRLIVGGSFTTLNNSPAYGMGSLDAASGGSLPWAANQTVRDAGANGAITSLKTDGTLIYGSGYAFGDGASFEGTFAADPSTGSISVLNDCHGDTYDVMPIGQVLYSVSHAHDCSAVGGFPDTNPQARWQRALAQTTYATGTNTGPDSYGWNYSGLPDSSILQWFPDFGVGSYTGQNQAAWSVSGNGDYVVMGGEFPSVNGVAQQGLVRMAVTSKAPNSLGPTYTTKPDRPTPVTAAASLSAGTARVAFGTAWDYDNATLTYDVLRDNSTWVYSTKITTNFWTVPSAGFIDTGLTPGSSHYYQVRIEDAFGNTQWSLKSNTVTISSTAKGQYASDVTADGATHYWRLGEPSGSTAYDWTGFDDLALNNGVTRGASGAIAGDSDGASTFDGTSAGFGVDPNPVVGPSTFSEEAWFKTTSTTGGKIVSFGDKSTGNSGSYDRHIYMDTVGHVYFGVFNGTSFTVNTTTAFNDGQWHHAVGMLSSDGLALFVDGALIGRNTGTTTAQPYTGYWRIGGDSAWSGNPYFNGTIDDVAIYPTALTATQVQQHYTDGRTIAPPNQPPVAAFTSTTASLAATFDGSGSSDPDGSIASYAWDYGDGGTAVGAKPPAHTYATGGTYTVRLTVADNRGATNSVAHAISVVSSNQPPVAAFTSTTANLAATFDGSGSSDPDGSIASYAWDYGDGGTAVGAKPPAHTYAAAGTYAVKLTVTDDKGANSSVTHQVTVTSQNQPPMASFTSSVTGLAATVDGTSSSDADGTIASYTWAFGDGSTATGSKPAAHSYASAGTYTVKLTVTDNQGASNAVTHTITVATAPTVLAKDTFSRTVTSGWGSATQGGAWTVSSATSFAVDGAAGKMTLSSAGAERSAYLNSTLSSDTDAQISFALNKVPTGGGYYMSLTGRRVSGAGEYRAQVHVLSSGAVGLSILKTNSTGAETVLVAERTVTGLTYAAGVVINVRVSVTGTAGTSVKAKVWRSTVTEPAAWMSTITDSTAALQTAGSVGVVGYLSSSATNAPVVATFDSLMVVKASTL